MFWRAPYFGSGLNFTVVMFLLKGSFAGRASFSFKRNSIFADCQLTAGMLGNIPV